MSEIVLLVLEFLGLIALGSIGIVISAFVIFIGIFVIWKLIGLFVRRGWIRWNL